MIIPKNIERRVKQHLYAKQHEFFAVVQPGFEATARSELIECSPDLSDLETCEGGISFNSSVEDVWKLNLSSRCLTRIMMRIDRFKVIYFEKLFEKISLISWELYLIPGRKIEFSVTCRHSRLYHSGRVEQECANGIAARMKSIYSEPILNTEQSNDDSATQCIYIRLEDDLCTVSLDTTGEPLYRRGFRTHVMKAPMRETLAAMILREADCRQYDGVLDPMCGSGVIPIEAALVSQGILSGVRRRFAFELWPCHRDKGYEFLKKKVSSELASFAPGFAVYASDISESAIAAARSNIENSELGNNVNVSCDDFFSLRRDNYKEKRLIIVSNPPYGERIDAGNINDFYSEIGRKLKKDFSGCAFAIIAPGTNAEKALGLPFTKRIPFVNGGIKVALVIGLI